MMNGRMSTDTALWSRRAYLIAKMMVDSGVNMFLAMEAVSSTAIEHPEWDMAERKTWAEWEAS